MRHLKTMFKKWSARGHHGVSQGSLWGQPGVTMRGSARGSGRGQPRVSQGSAIVFTVFDTFLNGQTVFRYVSKRLRNTLKQCSKSGHWSARVHQGLSQGSPGAQPGVSQGSGRGQPRFSQVSPGGQSGFTRGSASGQP